MSNTRPPRNLHLRINHPRVFIIFISSLESSPQYLSSHQEISTFVSTISDFGHSLLKTLYLGTNSDVNIHICTSGVQESVLGLWNITPCRLTPTLLTRIDNPPAHHSPGGCLILVHPPGSDFVFKIGSIQNLDGVNNPLAYTTSSRFHQLFSQTPRHNLLTLQVTALTFFLLIRSWTMMFLSTFSLPSFNVPSAVFMIKCAACQCARFAQYLNLDLKCWSKAPCVRQNNGQASFYCDPQPGLRSTTVSVIVTRAFSSI